MVKAATDPGFGQPGMFGSGRSGAKAQGAQQQPPAGTPPAGTPPAGTPPAGGTTNPAPQSFTSGPTPVYDFDPESLWKYKDYQLPSYDDLYGRAETYANPYEQFKGSEKNMMNEADAYKKLQTQRDQEYWDSAKGPNQWDQQAQDFFSKVMGSGGGGGGYGGGGGGYGGGRGYSPPAESSIGREMINYGKEGEAKAAERSQIEQESLDLFKQGKMSADEFAKKFQGLTPDEVEARNISEQLRQGSPYDKQIADMWGEMKGGMTQNPYELEAADLLRSTTGDIVVNEQTPQMKAAYNLFNMTTGEQLKNQAAAMGLGRSGAALDMQSRGQAAMLPQLLQNEQQFQLQQREGKRSAAGQLAGLGSEKMKATLAAFQTGSGALGDVAGRQMQGQQAAMAQRAQLGATEKNRQLQAYQSQADALNQQAQQYAQQGNTEKAREMQARAQTMQAYAQSMNDQTQREGMAASGAAQAAAAAQAQAQFDANMRMRAAENVGTFGQNMFGRGQSAYQDTAAGARNAMDQWTSTYGGALDKAREDWQQTFQNYGTLGDTELGLAKDQMGLEIAERNRLEQMYRDLQAAGYNMLGGAAGGTTSG